MYGALVSNLTSDKALFFAFEGMIAACLTWSLFLDLRLWLKKKNLISRKGEAILSVQRGKNSWGIFVFVYSVLSTTTVYVLSEQGWLGGHRLFVYLCDQICFAYLICLSRYFRNFLIRATQYFMSRQE